MFNRLCGGRFVARPTWLPRLSAFVRSWYLTRTSDIRSVAGQSIIHAIKQLAISTGPLKASLPLHFPPIDLVVYQGPSFPKETETSSRGGLHA